MVDAAEALLERGGFDGLSVRHLADELGVSRQVVYTHFGGVDGLLDALHRRGSNRLAGALSGAIGEPGTEDHVVSVAMGYLGVARRHADLYRLVFEQPVPDHRPSDEERSAARTAFGHVVAAVDAWLHERVTTVPNQPATWPPDAVDLARAAWTSTHGFVVLERVGFADRSETDRLVATAIRALLAGWPR